MPRPSPCPCRDIAARQEISLSYLEQLFARLRRAELVKSVRGPGGGYRLARGSAETRVSEIILAVDEPIKATRCTEMGPGGLPGRPQQVPDPRPVGGARQPDSCLPELGHPARRAGAQALAAHRRGAARRGQLRFDGRCQLGLTHAARTRTSTTTPPARCGRRRSTPWSRRCGQAAIRRRSIAPAARRVPRSTGARGRWRRWSVRLPARGCVHVGRHRSEQHGAAGRPASACWFRPIEHESVLKAVPDAGDHSGRRQWRDRSRRAGADAGRGSRRWCR